MSDLNSNALAALQGDLSTNVVMGPQLFNMLEVPQKGFMSREEAIDVRSNASPMALLMKFGMATSKSTLCYQRVYIAFCNPIGT